jgi:D-lactate dehydrogenase
VNPTNNSGFVDLISTRAIDRYRISSDASHFLLIPQGVATPLDIESISLLFRQVTNSQKSVTFRSGGTSLSGQAVTDGILIDTRRHFRGIELLHGGAQVKVQPGATVRTVNARLARMGRKLGPDPASEIACTVGGVIANNSSGMACGITENTYQTLESATVLLANGEIINTADGDSDAQLKARAPELYQTLGQIKEEISARPDLISEITRQYQMKNTMGYGLNSFIDYSSIIDIFLHLLVGSEGTLGFISEAIFNTVPLLTHAATTLLIFENLNAATEALTTLIATNPATIELMDCASLRAGKVDMQGIELNQHAALLVEYQVQEESELSAVMASAAEVHAQLGTVNQAQLTTEVKTRSEIWHIRKGLYAAVAGARRSGTTALLEDVSVPIAQLASTCLELQSLFTKHGYDDAVIFGHAKDGNIHFLVNEDFKDPKLAERYRCFTEEMVDLVLSKGGSLKAEHGTGRMMAPFVERQFGAELYAIMVRIKEAFDPSGILSPGVLISTDALSHMRHIKFNPPIQKVADNCVECGYCEPICPSKDLTTTPRQRIVLQRAIATAKSNGDHALLAELVKSAEYHVEETCAVDGLCESSCPVGINTGILVTTLRTERNGTIYANVWEQAAQHWGATLTGISMGLNVARLIPSQIIEALNRSLRNYLGSEKVPLWSKELPKGGKPREFAASDKPDFVFFASCLESIFEAKTAESLKSLSRKAGLAFTTPPTISDLCCGTPWKSKGLVDGYKSIVEATYKALVIASEDGLLPIVCENSSCTEGLIQAIKSRPDSNLRIIDSIDFAIEFLLPNIEIPKKMTAVALHPTCSSTLLGSNTNFETLAGAISEKVSTPLDWGCCAFAGDRGALHPELTASATKSEAASLALEGEEFDAYLSTNITCEIGMSRATGKGYQHILVAVNELAKSRKS